MLGFLTGAVIFGLTYRSFMPQLKEMLSFGALPLPELLNISAGLSVVVFALMFVFVLYILDRTDARRKDKLAEPEETSAD
ncbi:MAG: hypothetical protein Kow00124_08650 [Anaerolineae bacterium]